MAKKRASGSSKTSSKRVKSEATPPKFFSPSEISTLAAGITDEANYNNLVELLAQYDITIPILTETEDSEAEQSARLLTAALFKCFQKIVAKKVMDPTKKSEKKAIVARWVQERYDQFKDVLFRLLSSELAFQSSLQLDSLDVIMGLLRAEAQATEFPVQTYQKLAYSLIFGKIGEVLDDQTSSNFILLEFMDKFRKYWDLQAMFFDSQLADSLKSQNSKLAFANFFTVIKDGLLFSEDEELQDLRHWTGVTLPKSAYESSFKARYQKCFSAMLQSTELTGHQYRALLLVLHKKIIPYLGVPAGLMDFLTDAYDQEEDDVVPILALNSLWELIKKYNLEYPDFYKKIYSLLTPQLLFTRYRSRFFRLCDLFLSSTHLASKLVASFIKKLARLALASSAPGVVIVIPFIYNLLKRHPTCMVLLHNPVKNEHEDPFDNEETDPHKTGAMGSSLWELETLMSHYHPNIATLAKIFGEPFRKPSYNLEDFLDWSYITLLDSERTRKYKGMASLEYEEWGSLFAEKNEEKVYLEGWAL